MYLPVTVSDFLWLPMCRFKSDNVDSSQIRRRMSHSDEGNAVYRLPIDRCVEAPDAADAT